MKKCKETKFIEKYLNNELDKEKKMFIQKHLETCPICKKEYSELSEVDNFLSMYSSVETPFSLNNKIMYDLNSGKFKSEKRGFLSLIPVAASLIIAFVLGIYISNATLNNSLDNPTNLGQDTFYSFLEDTL